MLRSLLWVPGLVLVGIVVHDLLKVTVQGGDGTLSQTVHQRVYQLLHALARRTGNRIVLAWAAPTIIVSALLTWTLGLWLGWTLVFWSSPGSVVGADSESPATFWSVVYYVGYTISTLGLGDLKTTATPWRMLTSVAALSGFVNLTFAITFVVPVAEARLERRELARLLRRSGPDAQALVIGALQDHPDGLQSLISGLHQTLNTLETKHDHAHYLHRFHDRAALESLSLALPALGEALLLIECALPGPPPPGLKLSRTLVDSLVRGHAEHCPSPLPAVPPPPSLAPLHAAGIATVDEAEFAACLAQHAEHRQFLRAMVEEGLWTWAQVARTVRDQADGDRGGQSTAARPAPPAPVR